MDFLNIRNKADELGGWYDYDSEHFFFPSAEALATFQTWMKANTKMKLIHNIIAGLLSVWRSAPRCEGNCQQGRGVCDCQKGGA